MRAVRNIYCILTF